MSARGHELALVGISHWFGATRALAEVSLAIAPGELIALLGPSGCGKTTLLQIIAGFLRPTAGEVRLDGNRIEHVPANKRRVGMVFQNYALFPHLSVFENVVYGLRARRASAAAIKDKAAEMLALVKMGGFADRLPRQLSGGQQQRVALARALAIEPGIVLLDEPFSALDKNLRLDMQIEIKGLLKGFAVTSIIVTHDQEEALSMADRIVVMNRGHIEQVGTPREIYETPATPFAADFIGKINVLPAVAEGAGRCRVGAVSLAIARTDIPAGTATKLYLRPEDIGVHPNGAAPAGTNALGARITKVEFLGAFCMVSLAVDAVDMPALTANVPRQAVDAGGITPGVAVRLSVAPTALRVLA